MSDQKKTKAELLEELQALRKQVAKLQNQLRPSDHPKTQAEKARWFDLLMKHSPDAINITMVIPETQRQDMVACTDRMVEASGRTHEELIDSFHDIDTDFLNIVDLPGKGLSSKDAPDSSRSIISWVRPDNRENYHECLTSSFVVDDREYYIRVGRDITDRKDIPADLFQMAHQLKLVTEYSRDGINISEFHLGPNEEMLGRTLVFCNDRYVEMSGRTREELMSAENLNVFGKDIEEGKTFWRRNDSNELIRIMNGVSSWIRPDGKENYHEWRGRLFQSADKLYMLGVDRDITEQRRTQQELAETNRWLQTIMDHSPDGIDVCVVDNKTRKRKLFMCNDRYVEMSGRGREELMAVDDMGVFEERQEISTDALKRRDAGMSFRGVSSWIRPDKKENYYEWVVAAFRSESGKTYYLGIDRDVTEQRRTQQELADTTGWLQAIMDHSPDGINICIIDEISYERQLFMCNDRYVEMSGRSREELMLSDDLDIFQKKVELAPDASENRKKGLPFRGVSSWIRPDKKENYYEWVAVPFYMGELNKGYYLGIDRDITEQRHMEEQLRQAQKMEAIGYLVGGIAHDFNNQLTVIRGYCDLLQLELNASGPAAECLTQIHNAAERSIKLTSQLLAYSRKQMLRPEIIDLNRVIENMKDMLTRVMGENISIKIVTDRNLGSVLADRSQVEQAIINLATNSRDSISDTGTLKIETANVEITEDHAQKHPDALPGTHAMMSITDTGTGIDEKILDHIFDPFFTTKEVGKGTGLGLSMVYGFVKQSNGFIETASKPGKGTTIKLYFPHQTSEAEIAEPTAQLTQDMAGGETVLVIEDEEAVRRFIVRLLRKNGYTVLPASNGKEALSTVQRNKGEIDLVITDVVMPEQSGPEALSSLSRIRPEIKTLYISGYSMADLADLSANWDETAEFLSKPFESDDLLATVRRILDQTDQKKSGDS